MARRLSAWSGDTVIHEQPAPLASHTLSEHSHAMPTGCVCIAPLPLCCAMLWLLQVRVMEDSNLCAIHAKR